MHGRRLATTNEAVCITSGRSGEALERLESWTTTHGIDLTVRDVGEDLHDADYSEAQETLGIAIGGDGTFLEGVRAFAPRRIPLLGSTPGRWRSSPVSTHVTWTRRSRRCCGAAGRCTTDSSSGSRDRGSTRPVSTT